MPHRLSPEPPRRASDSIADVLIAEIRGGAYTPGATLPTERALCERFAASRPTVREALAQMQMRGFLDAGGGQRPRVTRPDLGTVLIRAGDRLRDVLDDTEISAHLEQMRQFIETGAAREAARRGDTAQMARLHDALRRNAEAIGTADFAATDIAFHRALVSIIGNPVMLTLHDMFVSRFLAVRPVETDPVASDRLAYDEHHTVWQAILDGNEHTATEVMERHLARSYRARLLAGQLTAGKGVRHGFG